MSLGPALIWKMGGDTSKFNTAIKGASSRTTEFKSLLKSLGPAFSIGLLIGGLQRLTTEISNTGKTARKLGVGVELLQEMRFAAELTGVAQSALDMGLQRFTRRLAEAAQGGGELKGVLEQYNIQLRNADGTTRSNVEVLGDLAEVIKNTQNPAEQLRIAFKAFDSEGAALVNTLRGGKEGLDAFREAARKAGAVIAEETVNQFEIFDDQITTVKTSIKGFMAWYVGNILMTGTLIGELTADMVNKLQGIETVWNDVGAATFDAGASAEAAAKKMKQLADQTERLTGIAATYAKITESQRQSSLAAMSTQEQINTLLEREVEIYNTQVAPAKQGSKQWSEGMLELEKSRVEIDKLLIKLAEEEAKVKEDAAKADANAAKADAKATDEATKAAAKAAEEAAEAGSSANRLKELNLQLLEAQLGEEEKLIKEIEDQITLESMIGQIMADTNVGRREALLLAQGIVATKKEELQVSTALLQSGASKINYNDMSEKELKYLLDDTKDDIFENNQSNSLGIRGIATSGMMQAIVYNVEQELDLRRQYENTSGAARDLLFNPAQQQQLDRVTTPQTDSQRQTRLLESIDDSLAIQTARYPLY